jgi:hypothetical protein
MFWAANLGSGPWPHNRRLCRNSDAGTPPDDPWNQRFGPITRASTCGDFDPFQSGAGWHRLAPPRSAPGADADNNPEDTA